MSLKIQAALLPQKHISFRGCLLGVAGRARSYLARGPLSLDDLVSEFAGDASEEDVPSVEHITLSLLVLYAISLIDIDCEGRLKVVG